jgi:hypothetical protein
MSDYITLGPTPADEPCAQVGEELYEKKARAECRRYIKVLRETFGPEPSGAYLMMKQNFSVKQFQYDRERQYVWQR